jgi:hypothetical protein
MLLTIRHFPDRKRPCIVLEEEDGCNALVLGYLTNAKREKWLRKALMKQDPLDALSIRIYSPYDISGILSSDKKHLLAIKEVEVEE